MTFNNLNIQFNFGERSSERGRQILEFMQDKKPFALYSKDRTFKLYNPAEFCSIDHDGDITKYGSLTQMQADIGFDIMIHDFVVEVPNAIENTG